MDPVTDKKNDDELSTYLSTACGERTVVVALLSVVRASWSASSHAAPVRPAAISHFIFPGRSRLGTALPEANSFLSMCQQFCNIGYWAGRRVDAGLTEGNLISTLEQSPARGDTAAPGRFRRTRRLVKHDGRA